jgi:hypothetical protein
MGEAYAISFDLIMSNQFNNQFHETRRNSGASQFLAELFFSLAPGFSESCAEKTETVSTVFRTRSHQAVETAWSRIASTHRAEARR